MPVADSYVSPGWYPSKAEHGRVVPTWNYEVVHLHGRLLARDDHEWLARQVRDLTDVNEVALDEPWAVDDAPPEFVDRMLRGIVGVELEVERIEGKRKLSQNRPAADASGVVTGLESSGRRGATAIGEAMIDVMGASDHPSGVEEDGRSAAR